MARQLQRLRPGMKAKSGQEQSGGFVRTVGARAQRSPVDLLPDSQSLGKLGGVSQQGSLCAPRQHKKAPRAQESTKLEHRPSHRPRKDGITAHGGLHSAPKSHLRARAASPRLGRAAPCTGETFRPREMSGVLQVPCPATAGCLESQASANI